MRKGGIVESHNLERGIHNAPEPYRQGLCAPRRSSTAAGTFSSILIQYQLYSSGHGLGGIRPKAKGPFVATVSARNTIVFHDLTAAGVCACLSGGGQNLGMKNEDRKQKLAKPWRFGH